MRLRIPALCLGLFAASACDQPLLQKIRSIQPPNVVALAPPEALRDVTITAAGPGQLHLAFDDTNNVKTGYRVSRRQGTADFVEVALVQVSQLTDPAHPGTTDTVTPGQAYDYQVKVVNDYGDSPPVTKSGVYGPVAPVLAWSGNPHLEPTCQLHLDGTVTLDSHWSAGTTNSGTLAQASSVDATLSGIVATVTTSTTGTGTATWSVQDATGTTQITRNLTFGSHPAVRMTPPTPTHDVATLGGEGLQPLWPTCATCTGRRAELSLGGSFGLLLNSDATVSAWGYGMGLGTGLQSEYAAPQAACRGTPDDAPCAQALALPTSVVVGSTHTCALIAGNVWCWGGNGAGQASASAEGEIPFPTPFCAVPGPGCTPLSAIAIAAGQTFTCALISDGGGVKCWGGNSDGELGNGTTTYGNTAPGDVCDSGTGATCVPLTGVGAIFAGFDTACAVMKADWSVRCWGYGTSGQLGDGTGSSSPVPTKVCATGTWDGATCVGGAPLTGVTSVALGYYHACAVAPAGGANGVYCWGDYYNNQVGNTYTAEQHNPVPVCAQGLFAAGCSQLKSVDTTAGALRAGYYHTCVTTSSHAVLCWGGNSYGQLGDGTTTDRTATVAVCTSGTSDDVGGCTGTGSSLTGLTALAAGDYYGCAAGASGPVRCWGADSYSRLGRGTGAAVSTLALPVCASGADATCVPLTDITAVAAASYHTCAVTTTGLSCWGANDNGQLGIGAADLQLRAAPVCATGSGTSCVPLSGVTQVSAGWGRACARMNDGTARCWGYDFSDPQYPTYVPNPTALCADAATPCTALSGIAQVSVSSDFACVLLASGQVRCLGNGDCGQLGDNVVTTCGDVNDVIVPKSVCKSGTGAGCIPLTGIVQVVTGLTTTCALDEAGLAWCWGDNGKGQVGMGPTTDTFAKLPTKVCATGGGASCTSPPAFVALAAGSTHFCALTADGNVYCWGDNEFSQIGDGQAGFSGDARVYATRACASGSGATCTPLTNVASVAAGDGMTCALLLDGTVKCWGYQGYLGDGGAATGETPVAVCAPDDANTCATAGTCTAGTLDRAVAVDAGGWMSCALRDDGGMWCWGQQTSAHLGNGLASSSLRCVPVKACATGAGAGCAGGTVLTDAANQICNQLEVTSP